MLDIGTPIGTTGPLTWKSQFNDWHSLQFVCYSFVAADFLWNDEEQWKIEVLNQCIGRWTAEMSNFHHLAIYRKRLWYIKRYIVGTLLRAFTCLLTWLGYKCITYFVTIPINRWYCKWSSSVYCPVIAPSPALQSSVDLTWKWIEEQKNFCTTAFATITTIKPHLSFFFYKNSPNRVWSYMFYNFSKPCSWLNNSQDAE